jgi:hypothetical protein
MKPFESRTLAVSLTESVVVSFRSFNLGSGLGLLLIGRSWKMEMGDFHRILLSNGKCIMGSTGKRAEEACTSTFKLCPPISQCANQHVQQKDQCQVELDVYLCFKTTIMLWFCLNIKIEIFLKYEYFNC